MLNKIIDTLKYGSGHTRRKLFLMLAALCAGVILLISAFVAGNFVCGLLGFVVLLTDGLVMLNTSFNQKTVEVEQVLMMLLML